jgi:hypothetical protein
MYYIPRFLAFLLPLILSSSTGIAKAQAGLTTLVLTPTSISLQPGQSTNFQATVKGTNVPGITWSLMPPVGTLVTASVSSTMDDTNPTPVSTVNGVYTAPSAIDGPQAITLIARSLVDSTKTASATIFLGSTVGIALTPATISLAAGQSATFQSSIGGTLNTSVSWSLNPAVGTITNGVYTAPAMIDTLTTIVLTVTSLADPSKTAQSTISLISKPTSISISPTQVTIQPSQPQQFTATIQGGSSSVSWSISPMVGNISRSGLYTPPSTVSEGQGIAVTATMSSDPTKSATALITLSATTPPPPVPPVQLPIEVIGLDGMTSTVSFNIPQGSNLNGPITLSMQIHGLRYETQASVQLNNGGWTPINSSVVTLLGNAAAYGGIGGGFSTLKMTMPVPLSWINIGNNIISFRFNGTDGRVSGFRVLSFNLLAGDGTSLLPSAAFVYEDPNTWQPPSSQPSDIVTGRTLYYTAPLTVPTANGPVAIQAHCTDCHAQDGRDLKYFNYSNNSIRTRSMFHGLTAQQGDQIASYIRTLNVVNPGRPWNPPYQPGMGLDSLPVEQWSAGAGIDAVLDRDADMMPYLSPGGNTAGWDPTANLNARETPIALQLPDWNRWLPTVNPVDAFGSAFSNNPIFTDYEAIRAGLLGGDSNAYKQWAPTIWGLQTRLYDFVVANEPAFGDPSWNVKKGQQFYSLAQWSMVKLWEINHEFGLERMPQVAFGPQADARAWFSSVPFLTSPNMLHIPLAGQLDNGKASTRTYLAYIWYHLQLILNSGNGEFAANTPIDFPYVYGFVGSGLEASNDVPDSVKNGPLMLLWLVKALQASQHLPGPDQGSSGWAPNTNRSQQLFAYSNLSWRDVTATTAAAAMQSYLSLWLTKVKTYSAQQFYQGSWASPTEVPNPQFPDASFANYVANMIPQAGYFGVNSTLLSAMAAWAQTVWPSYNWAHLVNVTCTPYQDKFLNCLW